MSSCTDGVRCRSVLCRDRCMLSSYEARLAAEQETGLRLRGELGLLKKRVGGFQGQAEELQAQLQRMHDLEASLHKVYAPLTCTIPCIGCREAQYLVWVVCMRMQAQCLI